MTKLRINGNYLSVAVLLSVLAFLFSTEPKIAQARDTDIDRPGGDYARIVLNADICEALCNNDQKCKSWSYVKPDGRATLEAHCWLKGVVGAPVRKPGVISGVKAANAVSPAKR